MAPLVSVILPCYNAVRAGFLEEAIESVLTQSLRDLELIVIDDGSFDETWQVISRVSDSRVRAFRQANAGLAATLNKAVAFARAPYIARQDQDDVMLPDRLAKQVSFMDSHPEVGGVGTWAEIWVSGEASKRQHTFPVSHEALSLWLLFDNPFVHSSMLLRRDALLSVGGYCEDRDRQPPEDYELWSRLARAYRMGNLGQILTAYREVPGSMSRAGENPFVRNLVRISAENLHHRVSGRFSLNECFDLACLYHGARNNSTESLGLARCWSIVREAMRVQTVPGEEWREAECREARRELVRRLAYRFLLGKLPPATHNLLSNTQQLFRRLSGRH